MPDRIETTELPPIQKLDEDEKSPSERLRAVLFIYWKQNTDQTQDFELFRRRWMKKTINAIKEQLL